MMEYKKIKKVQLQNESLNRSEVVPCGNIAFRFYYHHISMCTTD